MSKKEKTITLTKSELQEIVFMSTFMEFDSHNVAIDQLYWETRSYLQLMDIQKSHRTVIQSMLSKIVELQK